MDLAQRLKNQIKVSLRVGVGVTPNILNDRDSKTFESWPVCFFHQGAWYALFDKVSIKWKKFDTRELLDRLYPSKYIIISISYRYSPSMAQQLLISLFYETLVMYHSSFLPLASAGLR